ncbi:MAG TPA: hypothetical protein H9740_09730 [Candidatus Hungatella pullicola]|nr:hypothetical protein [Candidatus Hungatella pullicola]
MELIEYIREHWTAWLFSGGYAVMIYLYRSMTKHRRREQEENKALREGVQALLRQEIIDFCLRYEEKGSAPVWAKQAEEKAYKAYEALGGNDVAHAMHERFMLLPPLEKKETE